MKTPKEKAIELIEKFAPHADWNNEYGSPEKKSNIKHAKQCALIAIHYLLEQIITQKEIDYYNEVKQEIEKL